MRPGAGVLPLLHLYWTQEKRSYQFVLVNALLVPAILAYLGWMLLPDDPGALRRWLAGCVTFGLTLGALAQVGFGVLMDRFQGRLDLIRSAPVPKHAYFAAQAFVAVVESGALVMAALLGFAALGWTRLDAAGLAVAAATSVFAGVSMAGLGAWIAFRASDFDTGNTVVAITALGLAVASPVFYEVEALPALLRPVTWLSPCTHIAPLLRAVMDGRTVPSTSLLATAGIGLALLGASYRRARWTQ